jgi:CheY-like chemotaxis protein
VDEKKVLVVDDDEESRELLSEVLSGNGYSVQAVGDVTTALRELGRDEQYALVIADLRMPDGTGLELLRDLRRQKFEPALVLMSSFISDSERNLALQLGAQALLEKPFRLSEMLQVVAELTAASASLKGERLAMSIQPNKESS